MTATAPGRTRARTSWTSTRSRLTASVRRGGLRPDRAALVDAAFTVLLVGLALVGFRTDFAGATWVLPAVAGLVLGLLVTHVTTAYRLPLLVPLAGVTVLYFLLGGPLAVRRDLVGGVLPSGQTLLDLAGTSVHGWKRLVTLLPPVDTGSGLLALPLIVGLLGGCVTYAVARRWPSPYAVLPAPLVLLALGIVLGTLEPATLAGQGAVFAVLAIGWMVARAARTRAPLQNGAGQRTRYGIGAALVGIALLAGYVVGPHLPGGQSTTRLVARSHVVPPIDVAAFASPLAGFRRYTEPNPAALWDTAPAAGAGTGAGHTAAVRDAGLLQRCRVGSLRARQQRIGRPRRVVPTGRQTHLDQGPGPRGRRPGHRARGRVRRRVAADGGHRDRGRVRRPPGRHPRQQVVAQHRHQHRPGPRPPRARRLLRLHRLRPAGAGRPAGFAPRRPGLADRGGRRELPRRQARRLQRRRRQPVGPVRRDRQGDGERRGLHRRRHPELRGALLPARPQPRAAVPVRRGWRSSRATTSSTPRRWR